MKYKNKMMVAVALAVACLVLPIASVTVSAATPVSVADAFTAASAAVQKADLSRKAEDAAAAQLLVNALPASESKTRLVVRLNGIISAINSQSLLAVVRQTVDKAEETHSQVDLNIAVNYVSRLQPGLLKTELLRRIAALQKSAASQTALEKATKAVEFAESSKNQSAVNTARQLVAALAAADRASLSTRLDAVVLVIQSEAAQSRAAAAVSAAESGLQKKYYDVALVMVAALPEGAEKTALLARLSAIDLGGLITRDATRLVEAAEASGKQDAINSAKVIVQTMADSPEKTSLLARLLAIQTKLDNDKVIVIASNAVAVAERNKTTATLDFAKVQVLKIPDATVRAAYLNRLAAIQTFFDRIKDAGDALAKAELTKNRADGIEAARKINLLPMCNEKGPMLIRLSNIRYGL